MKPRFKSVNAFPDFPKLEEEILKFWQAKKIFLKSINQKKEDNRYTFYDGPPFVTGVPHYGTLLSSIAKDVIPRFWTMKGKKIRRVWGWDCHGLPIENKVEEKLHLKNKKDIEDKIGIEKFIQECLNYVATTSPEWKWYIDHIGRWVDFDNAYKTMDLDYMESVMWVFKEIYNKGLIYQGKRVSLYCPHCATPVSNFEIAMDNSYIDIRENSTVYKYQLQDQPDTFILAWSTTPWNKLVTPALAINPELVYVKVKQNNEYYILAESTLKILQNKYQIIKTFKGKSLEGLKFKPHYDYYQVGNDPHAFKIYGADFVTAEEGTGVVTIAAYGEDDYKLMKKHNIPILEHVDEGGFLKQEIKPWQGMYYLKADPEINKDLADRNLIYREIPYTHSVPVCWRCKNRLYYAPQKAWFMAIDKLKPEMYKTNKNINWVPKYFKYGRFKKGIDSAPDWCISRSRYWGSPIPIWICSCGEKYVIGSIAELEQLSGQKVTDLHRPFIDKVTIKCKCGNKAIRIPEVLDCWIESGSMPYAERHYPFENKEDFKASFPADFVSEYVAQTRAWFYVMHVISNALFQSHSFKNVVVTGVIMGSDGRKMSKSYGNYPDPKLTLQKYGGDSLRLYLMGSQLMIGKDINIAETGMMDAVKTILLPLWNCYRYFINYALMHNFKPYKIKQDHILDKWIILKLRQFNRDINEQLSSYQISLSVKLILPFISDLSTWYIRRSRLRFVNGDKQALNTLYYILINFVKLIAPVCPFISEAVFLNLSFQNNEESVHLCNYPETEKLNQKEHDFLRTMEEIRNLCFLGNAERKKIGIKLRQPLREFRIYNSAPEDGQAELRTIMDKSPLAEDLIQIIKDELNVKKITFIIGKNKDKVSFDTVLTPQLKKEGEAREIIRKIQSARKAAGFNHDDKIIVYLASWPKQYEKEIKIKAIVAKLIKNKEFKVVKN